LTLKYKNSIITIEMPDLFLPCPQCGGLGFIENKPCPKCGSSKTPSIYLKISQKLFYFDFKKINSWQINKRRLNLKITKIINVVIFCFGAIGVLLLAYYLYQQITSLDTNSLKVPLVFFKKNFWQIKNWALRGFFISALLDLYLIYRIKRDKEQKQTVILKKYQSETAPFSKEGKTKINITASFSENCKEIIEKAYFLALNNQYKSIRPLHLLAAILEDQKSSILLWRLGINPGLLAGKIKHGLKQMWQNDKEKKQQRINFDIATKKIILQAYYQSFKRGGGNQVKFADLWIPLAEIKSYAKDILYDLEIESNQIKNIVMWMELEESLKNRKSKQIRKSKFKSKHGMNRSMTAVQTKFLNKFSQDLTLLTKKGAIMPSLGHQKELEEIFTVLQSGARGVILVGNPGVGKKSLVQEIASRMAAEQVPEILQDKRLLSLSISGIIASGNPAASAQRLYQALGEAAHSGNVVLFLKDLHNLVNFSLKNQNASTAIDQVLSQALESNRIELLATSDPQNYARYIEKSPLAELITKIEVKEPDPEEAVLMLEARVPYIEGKHQVFFTYQALEKAVELTNKLIHTNEYQPAKALKILQQTASFVARQKGKKTAVQEDDVVKVISEKINMPLEKIAQKESKKLLNLEKKIHKNYINQDYAVKQVASALRRARAEIRDENRPIANFLFVGPTGVGKTELSKKIAEIYFNSKKDIIRIDMSEFQETKSIQRLIGTNTEPGILTESVRKNPYSILLLDELEKAHQNIYNLFLQVLDDGRLTAGNGEIIDFTNLIIIATANAGTKKLQEYLQTGKKIIDIKEKFIKEDLLEFFAPEFLNRFDDIVIFTPLSQKHIQEIAKIILKDIKKKLKEKGISLKVTKPALEELAEKGFDPLYGARPLRRSIQDTVQNALANFLISGKINRRDTVVLEPDSKIKIKKAKPL